MTSPLLDEAELVMRSWISRQRCQYPLDVGERLFVLSCAQSYGDRDSVKIRIVSEFQGALDCFARPGMIGLMFVNAVGTPAFRMAPWGGTEPRLVTDPLAFGIP
ncbi:MAG: Ldh family oxidoreductase, partial [Planctomycetes bacterium]|nr:Ldh family oxidoreductase [Planctomycetota bacterium]